MSTVNKTYSETDTLEILQSYYDQASKKSFDKNQIESGVEKAKFYLDVLNKFGYLIDRKEIDKYEEIESIKKNLEDAIRLADSIIKEQQ